MIEKIVIIFIIVEYWLLFYLLFLSYETLTHMPYACIHTITDKDTEVQHSNLTALS